MKKETYLKYIEQTIENMNKSTKKELLKRYEQDGLTIKPDTQEKVSDETAIKINYNDIDGTIIRCINNNNNKAIENYEKYQYTKSYKYSVLFKTTTPSLIKEMLEKIPTYVYEDETTKLFDNLAKPQKIEYDEYTIINFNKKYEAVHPQTTKELLLQYPIVIIIYKNTNIIEFRFDTIKHLFIENNGQLFYVNLIDEIMNYFYEKHHLELEPLNLEFMRECSTSDKNIILLSQYMNFKTGSKAQLTVGNNEEYILPLIGELKNIMKELKTELDNNIKIKDALEQFIYEKEETTDYPWIEVLFKDLEGVKTRDNHVKFIFNYMNKNYCLINYYYNEMLVGMERMNYVTNYIRENINKNK